MTNGKKYNIEENKSVNTSIIKLIEIDTKQSIPEKF